MLLCVEFNLLLLRVELPVFAALVTVYVLGSVQYEMVNREVNKTNKNSLEASFETYSSYLNDYCQTLCEII